MFDFMDFEQPTGETHYASSGPNIPDARDCMSCGQCLSRCPTYQLTQDEQEGPRQRIRTLSRLVVETQPVDGEALKHLDNCLQCRACEAVCPSKMDYSELYDQAAAVRSATRKNGFFAALALYVIAHKPLFNALLPGVWLYINAGFQTLFRQSGVLKTLGLDRADALAGTPALTALKPFYPVSEAKGTVALFTGCIGDRFDRATLNAAVAVLNRMGYSVRVPEDQVCCGAMHYHNGDPETGKRLMRRNVEVFDNSACDAVVFCATGCGTQMLEYPKILEAD
ncbi:MAG: (Fe-S)-binding protein, partial [Gammaproteobacteria bacterium]